VISPLISLQNFLILAATDTSNEPVEIDKSEKHSENLAGN